MCVCVYNEVCFQMICTNFIVLLWSLEGLCILEMSPLLNMYFDNILSQFVFIPVSLIVPFEDWILF